MDDDGINITTNLSLTSTFTPRRNITSKEANQTADNAGGQRNTFHKNPNRIPIYQKRPLDDGERNEDANGPPTKVFKREHQQRRSSGKNPNRRSNLGDHDYVPRKKFATNVVSSLFFHNPEVPEIKQKEMDPVKESVFATKKFEDLNIHPYMVSNLRDLLKIETVTVVQEKVLPLIFEGKDILVKSQTGSGKTLAYAIPIIQGLQARRPKLDRLSGIFALVVLPTRELALQTYEIFRNLCRSFQWLVPTCFMGGQKVKSEKAQIRRGINILISTPQRLLEHIKNSSRLVLTELQWLVLDEADRLMDLGYEKDITTIVETIRKNCRSPIQTILLSATLNEGVHKLAGLSLTNATSVDVATDSNGTTDFHQLVCPEQLAQHFIVVPAKLRLVTLATFVFWKCAGDQHKIIIFMSTQDMVEYHATLLNHIVKVEAKNLIHIKDESKPSSSSICISQLHGNMDQQDRTEVFNKFRECKTGILLCTDVAARGLDLPQVNWIIQYTTPNSAAEYVHRVGRTARIGGAGNSLLFLLPSERNFVLLLEEHNISLDQMLLENVLDALPQKPTRSDRKNAHGVVPAVEIAATRLQGLCESAVLEDQALYKMAVQSYVSYVRAYASYSLKLRQVCPYKELHLGHLAKSMALQDTPVKLGQTGATMGRGGGFRGRGRGGNYQQGDRFGHQRSHHVAASVHNDILSEYASGL